MLNKEIVEELHKQGFNYQQIGNQLGISRQRVHQIIKNYKNIGRGNGREFLYRDMGNCDMCKKKVAKILHHKDFNNSNDKPENLQPLCIPCHYMAHRGRPRESLISDHTKEVIRLLKEGKMYKYKIAEKCGVNRSTVVRIMKKYNIDSV